MDTDNISLLNITMQFLAELFARFFSPVSVDRTIEVEGRRVRIRVEDETEAK